MSCINESRNLFFDILKEKNEIINKLDTNKNFCLITGEPLETNYIELDCKHCFNYIPIYNEVVYQKTKRLLDNRFLKTNQIKCPYCRKITNNLLPYFKYYNVKNIYGVTSSTGLPLYGTKCCNYFNKKTLVKCNNSACNTSYGFFCNKHIKYTIKDIEIIEKIDKTQYQLYKKFTIIELKKLLKLNNLKQTGNKEDLINRLIINKVYLNNI
tara:strand:+ start:1896 stop:2528 length:633 start_codon:yes stop_codon:yes gene_type:complete